MLRSASKGSPRPDGDGPLVEVVNEYSSRNFFTTINMLKIIQKAIKHRPNRTLAIHQAKISAQLRKALRINQPMLQLQMLKVIKCQMVWCGRKWRQNNMKIITAIYLNCRPDLRDEWLGGTDAEQEATDAEAQAEALRHLIDFYNKQHYPSTFSPLPPVPSASGHMRSTSASAPNGFAHGESGGRFGMMDKSGENEEYNPDAMTSYWQKEYEDVLSSKYGAEEDDEDYGLVKYRGPARSRWTSSDSSDEENVVSVGELGDDARLQLDSSESESEADSEDGSRVRGRFGQSFRRRSTDNENTWEVSHGPSHLKFLAEDGSICRPASPNCRSRQVTVDARHPGRRSDRSSPQEARTRWCLPMKTMGTFGVRCPLSGRRRTNRIAISERSMKWSMRMENEVACSAAAWRVNSESHTVTSLASWPGAQSTKILPFPSPTTICRALCPPLPIRGPPGSPLL